MTHSRRHAEFLLIEASRLLGEIGLSINAGKVQHLESRDDFLHYWNVSVFDPLNWEDGGDPEEFVRRAALQDIHDRTALASRPRKRRYVVQKLIWSIGHKKITANTRSRLISFAMEEATVGYLNPDQMRLIFDYRMPLERTRFLEALSLRDMVSLHSEFHYRLERFLFALNNTSFLPSKTDVELAENFELLPTTEKQRRAQRINNQNTET